MEVGQYIFLCLCITAKVAFPPIRAHLFQDDHGILCRDWPGDREGGSRQGDIGQTSLPDPSTVVGDLEGATLVVVQPTSYEYENIENNTCYRN